MREAGRRFDEAMAFADQAREEILALLEGISQQESEWKADPASWSLGEIAHHLVLAERRFPDQVLEAIHDGEQDEHSREEALAERPYPLADAADVKKSGRGNAPAWSQPSHGLPIQDLIRDLRQARRETRERLLPYRDRPLERFWWRHPRIGPMDLYERVHLAGYHDQKHLQQMKRCQAAR